MTLAIVAIRGGRKQLRVERTARTPRGRQPTVWKRPLGGRIADGLDVPPPSKAKRGHPQITLSGSMAAKASLYLAMREAGITRTQLARRLAVDEKEVRRMLNARQATKLPRIEQSASDTGEAPGSLAGIRGGVRVPPPKPNFPTGFTPKSLCCPYSAATLRVHVHEAGQKETHESGGVYLDAAPNTGAFSAPGTPRRSVTSIPGVSSPLVSTSPAKILACNWNSFPKAVVCPPRFTRLAGRTRNPSPLGTGSRSFVETGPYGRMTLPSKTHFDHIRASTAWAALWPGAPVTSPPGCVPDPQTRSVSFRCTDVPSGVSTPTIASSRLPRWPSRRRALQQGD